MSFPTSTMQQISAFCPSFFRKVPNLFWIPFSMDIYEPVGDTSALRPVVILAHAGDFLPPILNQSPYGSKEDFAVAETCRQLARRGFVAISMEYRIGFNPFGSEIDFEKQESCRLPIDSPKI